MAELMSDDAEYGDMFGISVSLYGDYALIGAYEDDDKGSESGGAYIFKKENDLWVQSDKLVPEDGVAFDKFGWSVSLYEDLALVGAWGDDDMGEAAGSAYIFRRVGEDWIEEAKFVAYDGEEGDNYGRTVAIYGEYALVGSWRDDDMGDASGSVYVYKADGNNWSFYTKLTAADGKANDYFAVSIAIYGEDIAVGAYRAESAFGATGAVYLFELEDETWKQAAKLAPIEGQSDMEFGYSVSITDGYFVVGARYENAGAVKSGAAYVFKDTSEGWVQQDRLVASDGSAWDFFEFRSKIAIFDSISAPK